MHYSSILPDVIRIADEASERVLHIYESDFKVRYKDDNSPITAADEANHIDKRGFKIPFVCGAQDLGEALRRVAEGASMIRLKGNAGTGNVMNAVRHARAVFSEIGRLQAMRVGPARRNALPAHWSSQ